MSLQLLSVMPREIIDQMAEIAAGTPPFGDFAEIGVYKGGSAYGLYLVAQEQERQLWLFDTFKGIPERTKEYDHHEVGDFKDGDLNTVKKAMPEARVCVGVFPDTIPPYLGPLSFVHADADQYVTTKAICELLGPRMVPGGKMIFDDWDHAGVQRAVKECLPGLRATDIGWNRLMVNFE